MPSAIQGFGSIVFAQQKVKGQKLPLFGGGTSGLIFRPGYTKIKCGKAADSSGKCIMPWCDRGRDVNVPWSEAIDKQCSWFPRDFGMQLKRLTAHQTEYKHLWYNEIIIDAEHWRTHLPGAVEAVFGNRAVHQKFLEEMHASEETHPFLVLDPSDWTAPFRNG